jgi:hypothetical protein
MDDMDYPAYLIVFGLMAAAGMAPFLIDQAFVLCQETWEQG